MNNTVGKKTRAMDLEKEEPLPVAKEGDPIEEITVYYPEMKFNPFPYTTFGVGGFSYKVFVRPGETPLDAYNRAWKFLEGRAKAQYISLRAVHEARQRGELV